MCYFVTLLVLQGKKDGRRNLSLWLGTSCTCSMPPGSPSRLKLHTHTHTQILTKVERLPRKIDKVMNKTIGCSPPSLFQNLSFCIVLLSTPSSGITLGRVQFSKYSTTTGCLVKNKKVKELKGVIVDFFIFLCIDGCEPGRYVAAGMRKRHSKQDFFSLYSHSHLMPTGQQPSMQRNSRLKARALVAWRLEARFYDQERLEA